MKRVHLENTARGFFNISGSFGEVKGEVLLENDRVTAKSDTYKAVLTFENDPNGVLTQNGYFENTSDAALEVNRLMSRFVFHGGDWEVYTQFNAWQNESRGDWQPLTTCVSAFSDSARSCCGATPFIAIRNKQTEKGFVFHLLAHTAWEINVTKACYGAEVSCTVVELGVNSAGFSKTLAPGEKIDLPEVISYGFERGLDLDCFKLHAYLNRRFPKCSMPILYNSWLYKFDRINSENVISQIQKAAEIGAEYFVVDAGWFGNGETWVEYRGDWYENMSYGFCGQMKAVSDMVRAHGMKFGFWLEIESAGGKANIIKEHPEYFIVYDGKYFLDFSNGEACKYITETVLKLVKRYDAEFLKFDFNQDMFRDCKNVSFSDYHKGHRGVLRAIKEAFPDIYLESCASGGMRMELSDMDLYDSCWLSDNHSPYEGMKMYKSTLLRMSPRFLEKWAAVRSLEGFKPIYNDSGVCDKLLSSHNCDWSFAVEVKPSFLAGFMRGGPFGISADLNLLSDEAFEHIKNEISGIKAERDFWESAVCHILADSPSVLSIEYRNEQMSKIKILTFALKRQQDGITVYPFVDQDAKYSCEGKSVSGRELSEDGLDVRIRGNYECTITELEKE